MVPTAQGAVAPSVGPGEGTGDITAIVAIVPPQ
jgi:hypothetical protein